MANSEAGEAIVAKIEQLVSERGPVTDDTKVADLPHDIFFCIKDAGTHLGLQDMPILPDDATFADLKEAVLRWAG